MESSEWGKARSVHGVKNEKYCQTSTPTSTETMVGRIPYNRFNLTGMGPRRYSVLCGIRGCPLYYNDLPNIGPRELSVTPCISKVKVKVKIEVKGRKDC
ncbi:hypothetical protein HanPI659440_Chr13g0513421 [Helianthus annuus]|nr:hypothetical protein HanPI659440_Chr13g0513421 [Helianthus annuus]